MAAIETSLVEDMTEEIPHTGKNAAYLRLPEEAEESKPVKVVIAGGGPAGLLAAHYLLAYGDGKFHVTLFDRGEDPREVVAKGFDPKSGRRYSMGIAMRGYKSIAAVEGLMAAVAKVFTRVTSTAFFVGGRLWQLKADTEYTNLVDRMNLCAAMLEELVGRYAKSGRLEVHFNMACVPDLGLHSVTATSSAPYRTTSEETQDGRDAASAGDRKIEYDLLIGADGVRSSVRKAMMERNPVFYVEQRDIFNEWFSVPIPCPKGYDPRCLHFIPRVPGTSSAGAITMTADKETLCFAMGWPPGQEPLEFLKAESPEEAKAFFDKNLPWIHIPAHLAWAAVKQPRRTTLMVKCGTYHDMEGCAVLIGDAAHATSPAIGNGCNASLVDAAVLARLLLGEHVGEKNRIPEQSPQQTSLSVEEIKKRIPETLRLFSALQVREGHALVDLSWAGSALDKGIQVRLHSAGFIHLFSNSAIYGAAFSEAPQRDTVECPDVSKMFWNIFAPEHRCLRCQVSLAKRPTFTCRGLRSLRRDSSELIAHLCGEADIMS